MNEIIEEIIDKMEEIENSVIDVILTLEELIEKGGGERDMKEKMRELDDGTVRAIDALEDAIEILQEVIAILETLREDLGLESA